MSLCLALAAVAIAAPAAFASVEEIYVREVYAGGAHNDSYVVLQASVAGQNQVTGSMLTAYGSAGAVLGSAAFQSDVANSESQMTLLIADTSYGTSFPGGPAQNLTMPNLNLNPSGGAVCWETYDCVAWGEFTGSTPSPTGTPAIAMTSSQRYVINRDIDKGCPGALDADDDTDNSFEDFSKQLPNPRNNNSLIPEILCEGPSSFIDSKPPRETDSTSAAFSFHSFPSGAELECRLRGEPFGPCESGSKSYSGLGEGMHQFQVRSRNSPDPAGNPASWLWEIDLTPPTATIENPPEDPNPGPAVTFYFTASEDATFECSLVPIGQPDDYQACATQKTYLHLDDGSYTFRVRAIDTVGHVGIPDSYDFTVDSTLLDRIPPETTITAHPPEPVEDATASFRYVSSERESMFQCKLDGGAFEFCLPQGITYDHLEPGIHSFEVRARDEKANVDPTPAAYVFSVVVAPTVDALRHGRADTRLTAKPRSKTRDRRPTFRFSSTSPGASFQCKLDGSSFYRRCHSPLTTRRLSFGRHRFSVRAVIAGDADPTPATIRFRVVRAKRKHLRRRGG
ncbi:MAG TPA: hypothetical protein VGF04_02225 [Solirubrobacterales bacterium]